MFTQQEKRMEYNVRLLVDVLLYWLELYEKYSTGTVEGIKLYLTQDVHNIKITLTENGDQILALNQ